MNLESKGKNISVQRRSLKSIVVFDGLAVERRTELEALCTWRRYRLGERVFERGSAGDEVFFIIEGSVNIVSFSATGREVSFARVGTGEVVGEMAAIDGLPRSASVAAAEDTLVGVLSAETFVDLLRHNGEVAVNLLRRLSTIVRNTGARVLELSSIDATTRVYAELLRLAKTDSSAPDLWAIKPLPPLRELAAHASTTRELVNNALNRLYPSGLIRRRGKNLYLLDKQALEDIVGAIDRAEPEPGVAAEK